MAFFADPDGNALMLHHRYAPRRATVSSRSHRPSPSEPPDPTTLHRVAGQKRVVFLKPLVRHPNVEIGEYTYDDGPDDALAFDRDAALYADGPERLVIGRFCAIASRVRFLMPGANHADRGRRPARSGSSARRGRKRWTS